MYNKLVIAPQIVVYQNLFKNSENIINVLENNNQNSLFTPWRDWYNQGFRRECNLIDFYKIDELDSEEIKKEKKYLTEIYDNLQFIIKDYFNEFEKKNGKWPDYIKKWDSLKIPQQHYYLDYFKWSLEKIDNPDIDKIMMEYHVDEFFIENQFKHKRLVITINWYLNNDYNGGEICVYDSISDKVYEYKPNPGDIVVMPSTYPFYHAVKYFNNADRYFLRTFVDYEVNENDHYDWNKIKEIDEEYIKKDLQVLKIESLKNV